MNLRLQRAKCVRLVKVIRSRYDHSVEPVVFQKLVDIGENVGNAESLSERACFRPVVVADRDQRCSLYLRKDGQMRELCNRARADQRHSEIRRLEPLALERRLAPRWSLGATTRQSIRPTVVPE
jgi:hypothetical protein